MKTCSLLFSDRSYMKVSILVLLVVATTARGQLHLDTDDALTYQFNGVTQTGQTFYARGGWVEAFFVGADSFSPGESLRIDVFEDSVSGPILSTSTFAPIGGLFPSVIAGKENAWQDLQGAVRLTMLNGSADFVLLFTVSDGTGRAFQYPVQQVPEPTALSLMSVVVFGGLLWWSYRRKYDHAARRCAELPSRFPIRLGLLRGLRLRSTHTDGRSVSSRRCGVRVSHP
jgi:hypothetical protein